MEMEPVVTSGSVRAYTPLRVREDGPTFDPNILQQRVRQISDAAILLFGRRGSARTAGPGPGGETTACWARFPSRSLMRRAWRLVYTLRPTG